MNQLQLTKPLPDGSIYAERRAKGSTTSQNPPGFRKYSKLQRRVLNLSVRQRRLRA